MMIHQTCYLNNLGMINTLGRTADEIIANILNPNPNQNNMEKYNALFSGRSTLVGRIRYPLEKIPKNWAKFNCRNNQLLATAYENIRVNIESLKIKYGSDRIGVILGTSTSGIREGEAAFKAYLTHHAFSPEFNYTQQEMGNAAEFLASYAGITGVHYTISTACSSSAKAFISADRLIKTGVCDAVIVGGSDSLCELTLNGFDSLELLSEEICNPFSINRKGLNIGEGAALFVLSREPSSIELKGTGAASDGYHMTAPDPNGTGAKLAIFEAMKNAGVSAENLGYVNLHGTGTEKNDAMEALVMHELLDNTPCSSTKPLIGHTLGAAGAQELGLCWLLLSEVYNSSHLLPVHRWDQKQDSTLPKINLISEKISWEKPVFMSNSFAFGGSNVCLILAKA